jgi:hypothetical protein
MPFAYFIAQYLFGGRNFGIVGIAFGKVVAQVLSESKDRKANKQNGKVELFHIVIGNQ